MSEEKEYIYDASGKIRGGIRKSEYGDSSGLNENGPTGSYV